MLFGFLLGKLCLRCHICEMSDAVAKLRPPLKQRFLRVFAKPSRESQYTRLFCGIRISLYFLLPFAIPSCVTINQRRLALKLERVTYRDTSIRMASSRPLQAATGKARDANPSSCISSRKASHFLATPSTRASTRPERNSLCIPRANSSQTVISHSADSSEDLRTQTLDRPADSLAQPRCAERC